MPTQAPKSILAVDFGSSTTRIVLIDVVDGAYQMIAHASGNTTIGYPDDDLSIGLRRILDDLSAATKRRFYDAQGHIIQPENAAGNGVDQVITTGSAGRVIRAVLLGLMPDRSLASAQHAITSAYVEPAASLHLKDGLSDEQRCNAIISQQPDLVFIAGGTDGGASTSLLSMVDTVRLALALIDESQRPSVLFAGNGQIADQVTSQLRELTQVLTASNVQPECDLEDLLPAQQQLRAACNAHRSLLSPRFARISTLSERGLQLTASGTQLMTAYYARLRQQHVVTLDIGSACGLLITARPDQSQVSVFTDVGLGHSAIRLLDAVGSEAVQNWLPFTMSAGDLFNYCLNKTLRPAFVPARLSELYIEHALLRAGARHMLAHASTPPSDVGLVLGAGAGLTGSGSLARDLLLMVDAVQPEGICDFMVDRHGLMPALGVLAETAPPAAVQTLDGPGLDHLGTVISLSGEPTTGETALSLMITTEDGEHYEYELEGGHLWLLPLPTGHNLDITMQTHGKVFIEGQRRLHRRFSGGQAGLLFDARGRPLVIPADAEERAYWMPLWVHEVTGEPLQMLRPGMIDIQASSSPEADTTTRSKKVDALRDLLK